MSGSIRERTAPDVQDGSYAFTYDIRNVSAKPIARWQPMFWTSLGTGGTLTSESESLRKNQVFLPGEVLHEDPPRLVPLTEDLKKRLNLNKARREMVILVMSDVVFQDGSRYENRSFVNSITSYFEQLSTDLNRLENLTKDYEKRKPR